MFSVLSVPSSKVSLGLEFDGDDGLTVEGNVEASNALQEVDLLVRTGGSNDEESLPLCKLGDDESDGSTRGRDYSLHQYVYIERSVRLDSPKMVSPLTGFPIV